MINKIIKDALRPLGIPVAKSYYGGEERTYITFFSFLDNPEFYTDNKFTKIGCYIQIDIFTTEDYSDLVKEVDSLMECAGFIKRASGPEFYDEKTGLYQKPLRFLFYLDKNIKEEN